MHITALAAEPLSLTLTESFGIAGGTLARADNVLLRVTLADGSCGLGEAAPFPAFNGDTQSAALAGVENARDAVVGLDARRLRVVSDVLSEACASPSARAAIEMACLDATCRACGVSMWHWFGGKLATLSTDITIVTGSVEHAASAAARAVADGFRTLKVKVGGGAIADDLERLAAVRKAAPNARFILDANASLSADHALELVDGFGAESSRIALFEQPCAKDDHAGLTRVRATGVSVAADESVTSSADLSALLGVVDVINVKLMKSGVVGAFDLALAARALGFQLMIGGLVESDLAMSVSACLAGGLGGFSFVDLDTALFVKNAPGVGGVVRRGAAIHVDAIAAGHGVGLRSAVL
jgi:L-alanine-DL-glutamate epimerase-like enolase superfamily enzyme